ncbi:unnamed protein product, partial [marine sediment metagenome]
MDLKRENDYASFNLEFIRKRDGDPTYNLSSGDSLGMITFSGWYDGQIEGVKIEAIVDGTVSGAEDMPGRVEISTTPDGEWDPVLRMTIDNAGNIKMGDGAWTNYVNIDNLGVL